MMTKTKSKFGHSGISLFIREIFANPGAVGAACPSSKKLARCMAEQVPLGGKGLVVELGAGTGVVTEALLQRGLSATQVIVIERSKSLANHLRKRFPQLNIIQGDACELTQLLCVGTPVSTVVSSLPLRSLPPKTVAAITEQLSTIIVNDGLFIQYTYNLRNDDQRLTPHFKKIYSKNIWSNVPPARVDVFQHQG